MKKPRIVSPQETVEELKKSPKQNASAKAKTSAKVEKPVHVEAAVSANMETRVRVTTGSAKAKSPNNAKTSIRLNAVTPTNAKALTTVESGSRVANARVSGYPSIGAHTNGGITGAVSKALEIGAQSMQIFIGSPQTWKPPQPTPHDITKFREDVAREKLGPVFVHGNYLVNLATMSLENLQKSVLNLHTALRLADAIGAEGLIFHPGSAGSAKRSEAIDRVLAAMTVVLKDYDGKCRLLMEVCAGQGQTIGDDFGELGQIIEELNYDQRVGVAWDTCHLYNAGFDVATEKGLNKTISEFDKHVGFEWLFAVHANDSKNPLGSRKDRHENIGQGYIGEDGFRRMLHHPELRSLPWILEVPGFEDKGPDRKNIDILHRLSK